MRRHATTRPGRRDRRAAADGAGADRHQSVSLWDISTASDDGEFDRSVLAGEADGRWLWIVLRPASALLLLRDDWILRDVSGAGPQLVELPFGGTAPAGEGRARPRVGRAHRPPHPLAASDGTQTPAELVRAAERAGLDVVAITDHDTADGWAEAARPPTRSASPWCRAWRSAPATRAAACTCSPTSPTRPTRRWPTSSHRSSTAASRGCRRCWSGCAGIGIEITADVRRAAAHGTAATGRPHVADALVALGVVADRTEAFDRYLNPGGPAYVNRYAAPLDATIRAVTRPAE